MLRYLRYLVLVAIGLVLVTVALANRDPVMLRLMPGDLADLTGFGHAIELPLFVVIFGGVAAGILIGFVWEWLREHKHRAAAAASARELQKLSRDGVRPKAPAPQDEVLALIDPPRKAG
jgi:lipopolysaccharide assembly protein A